LKDGAAKRISFQFQCVTWKLEKALGDLTYDRYDISDEVREQVKVCSLCRMYEDLVFLSMEVFLRVFFLLVIRWN
jgi:hypothetical protein